MEQTAIKGTIFDIQHFSVSDGPGIRTTVFFKGCPLRCKWCHNPESYVPQTQIMYVSGKCSLCGKCAQVCPSSCHSIQEGNHRYLSQNCTGCGRCAKLCPAEALTCVGQSMSVGEILSEVLADSLFYETSGGGLTLSGGEPMLQSAFALAIAKEAKANGLNVCMETCGFASPEKFQEILPYIDLFLYDYKLTGAKKHQKYTGVSNELILSNLALLDRAGKDIILRCPIIPDVNTDDDHMEGIIQTANQLTHLREIHLEPYHNAGVSKWQNLGLQELPAMLTPPDTKTMDSFARRIAAGTQKEVHVM